MTFGSTLRELTELCHIKRCNLADALGYDASYISRWVNDIKLPAAGNQEELFRSIGEYITENCDVELRQQVVYRFSLDCPTPENDTAFCQAIATLLATAYRDSQNKTTPRPQRTGRENASLFRAKVSASIPESIFDSVRELAGRNSPVDMICTMPIHTQFKNNEVFFRQIRATVPKETHIHITQFVDMSEFAATVDTSCRSFCYLMGSPYHMQYDFYEMPYRRNSGLAYLIRDGVLLQYLRSPFSKDLLLLESNDTDLITQYCSEADNYIMNRPAINVRPNLTKLLKNRYFLEYFMQPGCRCLLKRMQPLFFPEELQNRLLPRERDRGRAMGLFLDGSRFFESMILFKSAFVDYIYSGRLMAFGHSFIIPREDRLTHLRYMLEKLSQVPENRLFILSTQNDICNFEDLPTSMFLSRNAAFALKNDTTRDQVMYTLSSNNMIDQLNIWLDHVEALPSDQCLTGNDAIEYISRCIRLL